MPTGYAHVDPTEARLIRRGGLKEITVAMIKEHAGVEASNKTVLAAFHKNGIRFRKMKEKLLLTKDDISARYAWASKHLRRSKATWLTNPQDLWAQNPPRKTVPTRENTVPTQCPHGAHYGAHYGAHCKNTHF